MAINKSAARRALSRIKEWAPERDIVLRTGGTVRFVHISTRLQVGVAMVLAGVVALWLALMLAMMWNQAGMALERSSLTRDRAVIARQAAQVRAVSRSVDDVARDLEKRQDALDALVNTHFGGQLSGEAVVGTAPAKAMVKKKISATTGRAADRFARIRTRQATIESHIRAAAQTRLARVEKAIRSFGLNPSQLASRSTAMGGPFIPARPGLARAPELRDLEQLLGRLSALEAGLASIPSGRPTAAPMETSSYGYRRDPFNGLAAFHAGIDFPGSYGQPILAAATGRVSYVGQRNGYGNVVEVDHGHGLMTRYAHLSGFAARTGDKVMRGQQIARMGSTGRSTGTHLHFEVRVNGAAVNPRPFLEARQDVLEVQQLAKRRDSQGGGRG